MRLPASEKLEIIRLVEQSHLPARLFTDHKLSFSLGLVSAYYQLHYSQCYNLICFDPQHHQRAEHRVCSRYLWPQQACAPSLPAVQCSELNRRDGRDRIEAQPGSIERYADAANPGGSISRLPGRPISSSRLKYPLGNDDGELGSR